MPPATIDLNAEFVRVALSSPLSLAVYGGRQRSVERLLTGGRGAHVNAYTPYNTRLPGLNGGVPPLVIACARNDVAMVRFLLQNGARANFTGDWAFTPLCAACHNSADTELLELLLTAGAQVNLSVWDFNSASELRLGTPLLCSTFRGDLGNVNALLHAGADPNNHDAVYAWDLPPITYAVHGLRRNFDIVKALARAGSTYSFCEGVCGGKCGRW